MGLREDLMLTAAESGYGFLPEPFSLKNHYSTKIPRNGTSPNASAVRNRRRNTTPLLDFGFPRSRCIGQQILALQIEGVFVSQDMSTTIRNVFIVKPRVYRK